MSEVRAYIDSPTDILGNTRLIDGDGDGKVAWDIGAYEFDSFKAPRCQVHSQLTAKGWEPSIVAASNAAARLQRTENLEE